MFKGLMHKTPYFKGQGRHEQEGKKMTPKTKGNEESKNCCKNFATTEQISFFFFFDGRGAIRIVASRHVLMCSIAAISVDSYAPAAGLFRLQEPLKMP